MYTLLVNSQEVGDRYLSEDYDLQRVVKSLLVNQNQMTLRALKKDLGLEDELAEKMDKWIDAGVIARYHGKYSVVSKVFSKNDQEEIVQEYTAKFSHYEQDVIQFINDTKEQLSFKEQLTYLLLAFEQSDFHDTVDNLVCFEDSSLVNQLFEYPVFFQSLTGKKSIWYSFEPLGVMVSVLTLPSYFYCVKTNKVARNKLFFDIQDMIGDVNPTYFMTYVERKIRRLQKDKVISALKPDIFMETLEKMNYVRVVDDAYQTNIKKLDPNAYHNAQVLISKIFTANETLESPLLAKLALIDFLMTLEKQIKVPFQLYIESIN